MVGNNIILNNLQKKQFFAPPLILSVWRKVVEAKHKRGQKNRPGQKTESVKNITIRSISPDVTDC